MKLFLASLMLGLVAGVSIPPARAADKLDGDHIATSDGELIIHPVNHATLVIGWKEKVAAAILRSSRISSVTTPASR